MNNDKDKAVEWAIRQTSSPSGGSRWGTSAPFSLGEVFIRRIGFADIPVVGCTVIAKDATSVVPVVRQHVFYELETQGVPNEAISCGPTVAVRRQRMFTDANEDSPTKGKNKRGLEMEFHFEIRKEAVHKYFTWSHGRGEVKQTREPA